MNTSAKQIRVLPAFLIFILIIAAYFPSLYHAPKWDQITYLAETADKPSWFELAIQNYDLNRTRRFCPGDAALFRPVLYFILGTERALFGNHSFPWQMIGIILHILICWHLLRLLLRIHDDPGAYVFTAFFSVLFLTKDMVTWPHIHAYLVFVLILIFQLMRVLKCSSQTVLHRSDLIFFTLTGTIACLTFEAAVPVTLLTAMYFLTIHSGAAKKQLYVIFLFFPALFYSTLSVINYFAVVPTPGNVDNIILNLNGLVTAVHLMVYSIAFWISQGVLTPQTTVALDGGNLIFYSGKMLHNLQNTLFIPKGIPIIFLIACCLAASYVCLLFNKNTQPAEKNENAFKFYLTAIFLILAGVLVLGRISGEGVRYLTIRSYMSYIIWSAALPLFYSLINLRTQKPAFRWVKQVLFGSLLALTFLNAYFVYQTNISQARDDAPRLKLIAKAQQLINDFSPTNGFARFLVEERPGNDIVTFLYKKGDPPEKTYHYLEALYWPHKQ